MQIPFESDYLVPSASYFVELLLLLIVLVVLALLVIWPLVETVIRGRWVWMLGVLLLGPIGGLLWFAVGRRQGAQRLTAS